MNTLPIMNLQPRMQPVGESFVLGIWYKKSRPGSCLAPTHITSCKIMQVHLQCTETSFVATRILWGPFTNQNCFKVLVFYSKEETNRALQAQCYLLRKISALEHLTYRLSFPIWFQHKKIRQQLRDSSCERQCNSEDYKFFYYWVEEQINC